MPFIGHERDVGSAPTTGSVKLAARLSNSFASILYPFVTGRTCFTRDRPTSVVQRSCASSFSRYSLVVSEARVSSESGVRLQNVARIVEVGSPTKVSSDQTRRGCVALFSRRRSLVESYARKRNWECDSRESRDRTKRRSITDD